MLVVRVDACEAGRCLISKGVRSVKIILSTCPIHSGCTIEVTYGEESDGRIPSPDPALKPDAERDFPDLVPVQVNHLERKLRSS